MPAITQQFVATPEPAGPAFESLGAGNSVPTGTAFTCAEDHTIGADATALLLGGCLSYTNAVAVSTIITAKCGTTPMTLLASNKWRNNTSPVIFGLLNPPTGLQSVSVTVASGAGTAGIYMNSAAYVNVSGFGTAAVGGSTSTSTSLAQTVSTGALGNLIFQLFVILSATASTIGNYNQAPRWATPAVSSAALFGDAPGAASVPFTATVTASPTYGWGAAAVPLIA